MEAAGLRQRLQESEVRVGDLEKQRKEQVLFLSSLRWCISEATSSGRVGCQIMNFEKWLKLSSKAAESRLKTCITRADPHGFHLKVTRGALQLRCVDPRLCDTWRGELDCQTVLIMLVAR
jgi:hypothetical protein